MSDESGYPKTSGRDGAPERDVPPSTPSWVKAFGIAAIVLVLLILILIFVGGGKHGPGRHMGAGTSSRLAAPAAYLLPDKPL